MDERLMTVPEVANYLQVHKGTVYSWVWADKLPCVRIGDLIRFRKATIEAMLNDAERGKAGTPGGGA